MQRPKNIHTREMFLRKIYAARKFPTLPITFLMVRTLLANPAARNNNELLEEQNSKIESNLVHERKIPGKKLSLDDVVCD